jgi:hypothetical protein
MIGPIRQELLFGISSPVQYDALKRKTAGLSSYPYIKREN